MNTSQEISELAGGLAAAQGEIKNPAKNRTNPHFKSKYADLADGLDAIRPVLSKHGLSFVQVTEVDGESILLRTRLMHKSGQWIEGVYPVARIGNATHQAIGSSLSYAKRYALFSLVGVHGDEDDDGNAAAPPEPRSRQQQAQQRSLERAKIGKPGGILSDPPTRGERAIRDEDEADRMQAERLTGPEGQAVPGTFDPETGEVVSGLTEEESAKLRDQILDKLEMGKLTRPALQAWLKATEGPRSQLWPNHLSEVRTAYAAAQAGLKIAAQTGQQAAE